MWCCGVPTAFGYHLATAADELWLGITEVVRGDDLWVTTGPQVALCSCLALSLRGIGMCPL